MLKEFAKYLVSLGENKTYEINGKTYSDHPLELIEEKTPRPKEIVLNSLDALAKIIRQEIDRLPCPLYVSVSSASVVSAFSTLSWRSSSRRASFCSGSTMTARLAFLRRTAVCGL